MKLIEETFNTYISMFEEMGEDEEKGVRMAFYAGASVMFGHLIEMGDKDEIQAEMELDSIHKEIKEFASSVVMEEMMHMSESEMGGMQ